MTFIIFFLSKFHILRLTNGIYSERIIRRSKQRTSKHIQTSRYNRKRHISRVYDHFIKLTIFFLFKTHFPAKKPFLPQFNSIPSAEIVSPISTISAHWALVSFDAYDRYSHHVTRYHHIFLYHLSPLPRRSTPSQTRSPNTLVLFPPILSTVSPPGHTHYPYQSTQHLDTLFSIPTETLYLVFSMQQNSWYYTKFYPLFDR